MKRMRLSLRSSACGSTVAVCHAAVFGVRRDAGEGGGLFAAEGSELGHQGDEAGGGGGADAGDGQEGPVGACEGCTAGDERLDFGLQGRDLTLQAGDYRLQASGDGVGAGREQAVAVGGSRIHQIAAGQDQGLKAKTVAVRGAPAGELLVPLAPVAGQRPGIDGIGLGERSEGADEGLDLAGVGPMGRDAGCGKGDEAGLMAAGGLADDQTAVIERAGKAGQCVRPVVDDADAAVGAVEDDDPALADVAAEHAGGSRSGGACGHDGVSCVGLGLSAGVLPRGPVNSSSVHMKRAGNHDDGGRQTLFADGRRPAPLPRAAARGRGPSRIMRNIPLPTHPQQTIRRFNRRIQPASETISSAGCLLSFPLDPPVKPADDEMRKERRMTKREERREGTADDESGVSRQ